MTAELVAKVLLIDDSDSNRLVLGSLLEDAGLSVVEAHSVAHARERLGTEDIHYDVVLLDQHLGDGLGTSLVPLLRKRLPRTKILMISGSCEGELPSDVTFDGTFTKGGDFEQLLAATQALIAESRAVATGRSK